jgi:hypothetical protein
MLSIHAVAHQGDGGAARQRELANFKVVNSQPGPNPTYSTTPCGHQKARAGVKHRNSSKGKEAKGTLY